jgi:hypothetical protein
MRNNISNIKIIFLFFNFRYNSMIVFFSFEKIIDGKNIWVFLSAHQRLFHHTFSILSTDCPFFSSVLFSIYFYYLLWMTSWQKQQILFLFVFQVGYFSLSFFYPHEYMSIECNKKQQGRKRHTHVFKQLFYVPYTWRPIFVVVVVVCYKLFAYMYIQEKNREKL